MKILFITMSLKDVTIKVEPGNSKQKKEEKKTTVIFLSKQYKRSKSKIHLIEASHLSIPPINKNEI